MYNGSQIATILQLQNRISTPKRKNVLKRVLKRILKGKLSMPNPKICRQSTIHTSHAAITMRFTTLSCKTQ